MEMYLKKDDKNIFRFPIIPSKFNVQDSIVTNDTNITGLGDVSIFGGKGLRTTEISSFFPNPERKYPFVNYQDYPKQYECVKIIKDWMDKGEKLRFIVTDTKINILMLITGFEYWEQDGSRDVYFTINLKEYRQIKISSTTPTTKKTDNKTRTDTKETSSKTKQTTYTVKSGDTLYDIAKKYYSKGSDYKKIIEKNKSKYPSLAKSTTLKKGWVLTI